MHVSGWMCTCHSMPVVRELLAVIYSLLPCGLQGSNADCNVYSKESLPRAPSHWPIKVMYCHNSWKSWVRLNPEASSRLLSHCFSLSLHLSCLPVTVRGSCSNHHSPDTESWHFRAWAKVCKLCLDFDSLHPAHVPIPAGILESRIVP